MAHPRQNAWILVFGLLLGALIGVVVPQVLLRPSPVPMLQEVAANQLTRTATVTPGDAVGTQPLSPAAASVHTTTIPPVRPPPTQSLQPSPTETPTVVSPTPGPPSATPTPSPTASQTIAPPTATAPPSDVTSDAAPALLHKVAEAEAQLQSGILEATLIYSPDTRGVAEVRFSFSDEMEPASIHILTTYASSTITQTTEYIAIGTQAWQRQDDTPWQPVPSQENPWGQVQSYLPHAASVVAAEVIPSGDTTVLTWRDYLRDAEVFLQVDPETGFPRQLQYVTPEGDGTRMVVYRVWNEPVEIAAPLAP